MLSGIGVIAHRCELAEMGRSMLRPYQERAWRVLH
jgi:hypothetical protein